MQTLPRTGMSSPVESKPLHDSPLRIYVLFTNVRSTLAALRSAESLGRGLDVRIELISPKLVPYPLPLDRPTGDLSFFIRRCAATIAQAGVDEAGIHLYLCREPRSALSAALAKGSIVFIGGCRRWWWPTAESRLGRWLQRNGHHVVVVNTSRAARKNSRLTLGLTRDDVRRLWTSLARTTS